jgi:DNA-binding MarR family transcriptional regulator
MKAGARGVRVSPDLEPLASDLERFLSSPVAQETEFLAARATAIGTAIANRRLREFGLRVRSYAVLSMATDDQRPTQRQLAEFLRLDPSQIVSLVDELETAGLVRREPDPSDRRSKVIVATPEGERVHTRASVAAREAADVALGALDADEREQLRALLARVAFPRA